MKEQNEIHYCNLPEMPQRDFERSMNPFRMEAIIMLEKKWVNGTKLKYFLYSDDSFFTTAINSSGNSVKIPWKGSAEEKDVVRKAFKKWKDQGIGLEFVETTDRLEAHVRIGFGKGEGSWSYVGRDSWGIPKDQRTMNFGWNILNDEDTVLHEIGHAMGFPHEHQNPKAGIVWDEEAVYTALAKPPNSWTRQKTFHNIIRKIEPDAVQGSSWDSNSIMHYPFGRGLIKFPVEFANGLFPEDGLSARDVAWVKQFYPKMDKRTFLELKPYHSEIISLDVGGQINLDFVPEETRTYTISTFGTMDTVMVLSEEVDGDNVYLSGDDDSGESRNSYIKFKMVKGKKYIVNIRLYYKESTGDSCVMLW